MPLRETQRNECIEDMAHEPLAHVRRVYASFAQGLFHAAPIGSFHWEPNMMESEIVITDENPINIEVVGKRPAISFTRGPVQFLGIGMDDLASYDFATGAKKKTMLVPGTMSINCCSRNDLESEYLAWVYAEQLWMHRELLMKMGMFEIGRQMAIGSPSPAGSIVEGDSADNWYVTTIQSPFQISRMSKFTPLNNPTFKSIETTVCHSIRGNKHLNEGPVATYGANFPWAVKEEYPTNLPKIKHPLDPTKEVYVRTVRPFNPKFRQPVVFNEPPNVPEQPVISCSNNSDCTED